MKTDEDKQSIIRVLRFWCCVFVLFIGFISLETIGEKKSTVRKKQTSSPKVFSVPEKSKRQKPLRIIGSNSRITKLGVRLNPFLGVCVVDRPLLAIGGQFGKAFFRNKRVFLGPEVSLFLDAPSSALLVLLGGWYEFSIKGIPKAGISAGFYGGVGFLKAWAPLSQYSSAVFVDITLWRELDTDVLLRAQIRPGLMDGTQALMLNLGVSFNI